MNHKSRPPMICSILLACMFLFGCSPEGEIRDLVVTYDGETCQYEGPESIVQGEVTVVLNNLTDSRYVHLHVVKLDEGKTRQDLVEYIGEAIEVSPAPWVSEIYGVGTTEGDRKVREFLLEPGIHFIVCGEHRTFPYRIAAPLEVKPVSSD